MHWLRNFDGAGDGGGDFLESPFNHPLFHFPFSGISSLHRMNTDIRETESGYEMKVELPGFDLEDIKVELGKGVLTISAQKKGKCEKKNQDGTLIRSECCSQNVSRSYHVGEGINRSDVRASLKNGILTVSYPKPDPKLNNNVIEITSE
ncbi:MAG: Hsp20/alpha crystallin family protein [Oscillospiraceae bacterium]|jgi:HSP20 family molecular chaperone IbpA|nr:Hsp20/alpha crystallin family protein [Oscillospiraceae bacterium]